MKKNVFISILFLIIIFPLQHLKGKNSSEELARIAEKVRIKYAPDKRVALFDVDVHVKKKKVTVKGITTVSQAKDDLISALEKMEYVVTDSIELLPEAALGKNTYGIINLSVANIRQDADYGSEMMTQAMLGMPVKILQKNGWYRIQTPDDYISWVNPVSVFAVTKEEYNAWNAAEKVVVTSHYGFTYEKPDVHSQTLSDIVSGNRLKLEGKEGDFYKVSYPDGRMAYVLCSDAETEKQWNAALKQDAESIIHTGETLMGVPYLWGGSSSKGVDCSGFVRTIMFLHGIILPRDASQQAFVGSRKEIVKGTDSKGENIVDCSELLPGDLLFFGKQATPGHEAKVIHVGMYIGNGKFIHSQGYVHIGSFNPSDQEYDKYNRNRLLWATRILTHIGEKGIGTIQTNPYYLPQ